MPAPRRAANVGVAHGAWGEDVAVEWLRARGYVIVDRNVHPCLADRRLELDVVAYDRALDLMVFVEVKQHAARSDYQRRLRSLDRRKRLAVAHACRSWLRWNRWRGSYRFDVIEVYGTPGSGRRPEVDHVERVVLFKGEDRFVNWFD